MSSSWSKACAEVALARSKLCARAVLESARASSKRKKKVLFMRAGGICVALASYSTMTGKTGRKYATRKQGAGHGTQGAGERGAPCESTRIDILAGCKRIHLLKNRKGGYDPGQLPHRDEQARSVDTGSGSSADRMPFPSKCGHSNMGRRTLLQRSTNRRGAFWAGVKFPVPQNGNEQPNPSEPSAI